MIGFWATLSLNMPDFTRFGRSQREQAVGQVVALPTTMTVFAAMGILVGSVVDTHPDQTAHDERRGSILVGFFGRNALLFSLLPALLCIPLSYGRGRVGF